MDNLKVGMTETQEWDVTEKLTTTRGEFKVFSTPSMTHLVESTANRLVTPYLKPGQGQVGISVCVRHMAPTPVGSKVRAVAELTAMDRRKLTFKVKVFDEVEQVGEADHERFVIDLEKYMDRLRNKIRKKI
jgi:fluoroacetyl-CoA thioesterase